MAIKPSNVAVIGLGTFGTAVARDLTMMGDRVIGIDIDETKVANLCDELHATLEADAADKKALSQCSLENYDAVIVSIGENTEASILAAMNVLELGCVNVWVKAQNSTHRKILEAIGVHNVVEPEHAQGERVAQIVHNKQLVDYMAVGNDNYVAQVLVPKGIAGKTISTLNLQKKHELTCVGLYRNETLLTEDYADIELQLSDSLLLYGKPRRLRGFADKN